MAGQARDGEGSRVSVSVIVPFTNALPFLEAGAGALRRQMESCPGAEVIFADAASTDGSIAYLSDHFPEFRLVRAGSHNAYAARNRAARLAEGRVLAFTDADCAVGPEWLASIHRAVQGGADLVMGPVEPPPGVSATLRRLHDYENARMEAMCQAGGHGVAYGYTNNLAIRSEVFQDLGGFDETHGRGGDSQLVLRALASGANDVAYARGMKVVHLEVATLRRWWLKKYLYGRSGTARRSKPPAAAYRTSDTQGIDLATIGALGIGRAFFELGRLAGAGRGQ